MQQNLNIEKIIFKVVQIKFLEMHINNQKLSFDIFTVGNLLNIFMEHDLNILMMFGIKLKCIILTHTLYYCYYYKYSCAAYDCVCAPGTHLSKNRLIMDRLWIIVMFLLCRHPFTAEHPLLRHISPITVDFCSLLTVFVVI